MKHLISISDEKIEHGSILCVALCHNERNILQDFFDHYRLLGHISFLIVDDGSSDGSKELLLSQSDVTLFQPVVGSTYKEHKRYWRQELLDQYGDGRWCLVPDIDEHFVYLDMENKPLLNLISEIENQGCEAMHAIMLDMYANKPLTEQVYFNGGLRSAFPYFDGPENYWVMGTPAGFRHKFPTPNAIVTGGMRERLFSGNTPFSSILRKILSNVSGLPFREANSRSKTYKYELVRRIFSFFNHSPGMPPLNLTKLPLIKWKKGCFFNGGTHALNKKLSLFPQSGALLHYRFTRGVEGLKYSSVRGQHAADGAYCKKMWDVASSSLASPFCSRSRKFVDSTSLSDFLL